MQRIKHYGVFSFKWDICVTYPNQRTKVIEEERAERMEVLEQAAVYRNSVFHKWQRSGTCDLTVVHPRASSTKPPYNQSVQPKSQHRRRRSPWCPAIWAAMNSWWLPWKRESHFSSETWTLGNYTHACASPSPTHIEAALNGFSGHWFEREKEWMKREKEHKSLKLGGESKERWGWGSGPVPNIICTCEY